MVSCCWRNGAASSSCPSKVIWSVFVPDLGCISTFALLSCFSMPLVSWDWNSFSAHFLGVPWTCCCPHEEKVPLAPHLVPSSGPVQAGWPPCSKTGTGAGSCSTVSWRMWSKTLQNALSMLVDHCKFEKDRYRSVQVWKSYFWETLEGRMCVGTLLIKARSTHASHWDIVMVVSYSLNS